MKLEIGNQGEGINQCQGRLGRSLEANQYLERSGRYFLSLRRLGMNLETNQLSEELAGYC